MASAPATLTLTSATATLTSDEMAILTHEVWGDGDGLPRCCLSGPMGDGQRKLLGAGHGDHDLVNRRALKGPRLPPAARAPRRTWPAIAAAALVACGGTVDLAVGDSDGGGRGVDGSQAVARDAARKDGTVSTGDAGGANDASSTSHRSDAAGPSDAFADAAALDVASTCGVCPGTCFGARCLVVLASGQENPGAIAVTARGVYWVNVGNVYASDPVAAVMTVGLDGGSPTTLVSMPGTIPSTIAADETSVVWVDTNGHVESMPLAPVGPSKTYVFDEGALFVAMDPAGIYWLTEASSQTGANYALDSVPRAGGAPTSRVQSVGMPAGLLVRDGLLYWQVYNAATWIDAMQTDGGTATTVASDLPDGEYAWTVSGAGFYWGGMTDPIDIFHLGFDAGPDASPAVVATDFTPSGMTSDETTVYFTNDNAVYEMPIGGGAPTAVVWREPSPNQIAVDDTSVYWTDRGAGCDGGSCGGRVLKLTPK